MKLIFVILFFIALFHLSVYYCNLDLYASFLSKKEKETLIDPTLDSELNESKMQLEKYLNELKQYDSLNKHG